MKIVILSASVRSGRKSHRVALFLERFIRDQHQAEVEVVDLAALNFPLFEERLKFQANPSATAVAFANTIAAADGVIIVTPEYNGGYPASLKNAIDLLNDQWRRKPVAISTVSDGAFGGAQVLTSLQFTLFKIRAWTVPALFPVPKVGESYSEDGIPVDAAAVEKRAKVFVDELLWCVEAKKRMEG